MGGIAALAHNLPCRGIDLYSDEVLHDPCSAYRALGDAGSAVWLDRIGTASANCDERQFADAHAFRIDRPEMQNLGFGHGPHGCAGQGLARMELTAVFSALAERVERFEIAGPSERALNNISRGFRRLPARTVRA